MTVNDRVAWSIAAQPNVWVHGLFVYAKDTLPLDATPLFGWSSGSPRSRLWLTFSTCQGGYGAQHFYRDAFVAGAATMMLRC